MSHGKSFCLGLILIFPQGVNRANHRVKNGRCNLPCPFQPRAMGMRRGGTKRFPPKASMVHLSTVSIESVEDVRAGDQEKYMPPVERVGPYIPQPVPGGVPIGGVESELLPLTN